MCPGPPGLALHLMTGISFVQAVWFLIVLLVAVLLLVLEGWRQSRKLKSRGHQPSRGSSMMAAGVVELQGILQPDRHVEQIQEEARDRDRLNPAHRVRQQAEGGQVTIRPAGAEMAQALSALADRAKSHWDYPAEWLEAWREELTVSSAYLAGTQVQVALSGDRPLGFYALEGEGSRLELAHLWVDPPFMGQGHGRRLVEHALREAARRGATQVMVVADPHAEPFYRHLGAQPAGHRQAPVAGQERTLPVLMLAVPPAATGQSR